jgi:peptidoglycan/xylan/chitin deacetylase (PgdA/CDA1 family)
VFALKTFILCLILLILSLSPAVAQDTSPDPDPPPAWDGTFRRIRVPILMYHYVSELPADADEYRRDLTLSPESFQDHVDFLFYQGYNPISLYQLDQALANGTPLPPKPVALTFDDGYIDHYTNVFPALKTYNFTGTFFIITGKADSNEAGYVNWNQIAEMAAAGMNMESHTKNHIDLRGREYDTLVYEMLGSMESLRFYTGRWPHIFCFPVGNYDDTAINVLETLPVWRAVTTENGTLHTNDNRLLMPRVRVSSDTTVTNLARLLSG